MSYRGTQEPANRLHDSSSRSTGHGKYHRVDVRKAAPPNARLVLVEWVIPETAEFDSGKWMDINMLVNAGGRERTASEFRSLYDQAGFELEQIIPTPSPLRIIIGKLRA